MNVDRHAMAYDSWRDRTVMFGGINSGPGTTWLWDGHAWARSAAASPLNRRDCAMAFDSRRGRVVMFGRAGLGAETWEWDGTAWTQVLVAGPPARAGHAMVFDSARERTVLFAGAAGWQTSYFSDTWEWDGSTWTMVANDGPPPRADHGMAFDAARSRTVVFGGSGPRELNPPVYGDTWEWDGAQWTLRSETGPTARMDAAMTYDPQRARTVLFGGTGESAGDEAWEWDGSTWWQVSPNCPPPRFAHAASYDSHANHTILFGGTQSLGGYWDFGDTWTWNGVAWRHVAESGPPARRSAAMAYLPAVNRTVLFGGYSRETLRSLGDTWEWNGAAWSQFSGPGPSPRHDHAVAYDQARAHVVLFGGEHTVADVSSYLGDMWTWDGAAWTQRSVPGPSPRAGHSMCYDSARARIVLFGGDVPYEYNGLRDTWEWDGSSWSLVGQFPGFYGRAWAPMEFDPVRGRTILAGGRSHSGHFDDEWEWDGRVWTQRDDRSTFIRSHSGMTYDIARSRLVTFGGALSYAALGDTLELASEPAPPLVLEHPINQSVNVGGAVSLSVHLGGSGPFTYQWVKSYWADVSDGPGGASPGGGVVSGATTGMLIITGVQPSDADHYRCLVGNACDSYFTNSASIVVHPRCASIDFDNDGAPGTDADITAFFACLAGDCCSTCATPDFNNDGDTGTDADIEAFFRVLGGGTC